MRAFAVSLVMVAALLSPRLGFCQGALGPDAYFSSAWAALMATFFLPPPPLPGTAAQADNIFLLNSVMASASPQAVARAQFDADPSVFDFSQVLGPGFTAQNLPVTNAFFQKVTINTQNTNIDLDRFYNSQGPVTADSYPSAHTVLGLLDGLLLSDMIPEQGSTLTTYGVQFGLNRLILGQHWPTDVGAGQMEAGLLMFNLLGSQQFQTDFNAAKAELRAQQGLQ